MIGTVNSNQDSRQLLLTEFLKHSGICDLKLLPLADDCSFRRYYRVQTKTNNLVVMDAPPDKEEVNPFIQMSDLLNKLGFSAPKILDKDVQNGFLLLEDFGNETYTKALSDSSRETNLYENAIDVLIEMHNLKSLEEKIDLPFYDQKKLQNELSLFIDWYLEGRLRLDISEKEKRRFFEAWRQCFTYIESCKKVLVLRDYHVDNLMVLAERDGVRRCGLLDFQDAVIGPASYDLVSLLQDSRRNISDEITLLMLDRYFDGVEGVNSRNNFMRSYYILGTQRALKVFGIFTRQDILYRNSKYLIHLPRLWRYTLANLQFKALGEIRGWLDKNVPQGFIENEITMNDNS